MAYYRGSTYNANSPDERLFLNTIRFDFPSGPRTFWFSRTDIKGYHLRQLNMVNFPVGIETIFPDLKNGELLYTSFDEEHEDMLPLDMDLSNHKNYYFGKRYYNRLINYWLKHKKGFPVEMNRITKDNQAWVLDKQGNKRSDCWQYDRFTVKVDYDNFNKHPQLVLSYDRPALIYKKSVADLLEQSSDPLDESSKPVFTLSLVSKVLYFEERPDGGTNHIVDHYDYLAKRRKTFNPANAYPMMWPRLADYLKMEDVEEEADEVYQKKKKPENRYKKYYEKIKFFYDSFLDCDEFRALINIDKDGFSWATKLQCGKTASGSQELVFGGGVVDFNPQMGVNNGPLEEPKQTNIQLIYLFHQDDKVQARQLLKYFGKEGYKDLFKGLSKYTGKPVVPAPKGYHLSFSDKLNPLPEIQNFLAGLQKEEGVTYLAIYLTPHGKDTSDKNAREIYYRVKKVLMQENIASQCIETRKMIKILKEDEGTDSKGRPLKNFAYTLQNMAIAINAKLGGIPWRIRTDRIDELVVGVGAFRTGDTQYIGSAFSFENTGLFNTFEYFLSDETQELAGSIEEAIINFTKVKGKPERLVIHYYKVMREDEYDLIEDRLRALDLDIPIYIISINKTESEDKVLFDGATMDMMPYSGRYINLGAKTYLLCNNTRYYGCRFNPYDGFPFPVKLRIDCPYYDGDIDARTIRELIDQVYQFSRIYWKSVKQQNLPVTIKYPEMVAEMAPHFEGDAIPEPFQNRLWFL